MRALLLEQEQKTIKRPRWRLCSRSSAASWQPSTSGRRFGMSYNRARHFFLTDRMPIGAGRNLFLPERSNNVWSCVYASTPSLDAASRTMPSCECAVTTSPSYQRSARRRPVGTSTAILHEGGASYGHFLQRWPSLRQYRAGTIEEGRARGGRPEGVAHWLSTLQLLYRDLGIWSPRQV